MSKPIAKITACIPCEPDEAGTADQLATLERERDEALAACAAMREALNKAVDLIRRWHGMGMPPAQEEAVWDIYWHNAPELEPIRTALSSTAGKDLPQGVTTRFESGPGQKDGEGNAVSRYSEI